jgi:hypothetical protein
MYSPVTTLIDRMDRHDLGELGVIPWSCPVPCFGDLTTARVATVGINPSNREFLDEFGVELDGEARRLPTLKSLGISRWADMESAQLRELINACLDYFRRNPYDRWFTTLERILLKVRSTYYGDEPSACHLDLVPYATTVKWGLLPAEDRRELIRTNTDALGLLIRESPIDTLILNGQSVVSHFEMSSGVNLDAVPMVGWDLSRSNGKPVIGISYIGEANRVGNVQLMSSVRVVGYNHNLQSSFGVTSKVIDSIASWISATTP